jgi:hypothetical protein
MQSEQSFFKKRLPTAYFWSSTRQGQLSLATQPLPSQNRVAGHLEHLDASPRYAFGHVPHPGGGGDAMGEGGTSCSAENYFYRKKSDNTGFFMFILIFPRIPGLIEAKNTYFPCLQAF